MLAINDAEFTRLTHFIKDNYGINLTQKKILVEGRLSNIVLEKGFQTFSDYLNFVFNDKSGEEIVILINRLTTNHTFFMRESKHFDYFRDTVLPFLSQTVRERDLRVWSAGCSTGEEPYTLEILMHEFFKGEHSSWNTEILATDISRRALAIAEKGIYTQDAVKDIPSMWKMSYFQKIDAENFKVKEEIRNDVIFRTFNLMEERFPFRKKFHTIFCRNVMIYFDQPTKAALVQKFYDALESGGYLFIGHSESIDRDASSFRYIMPAVYRKG